jgi:hypothetical protein
LVKLLKIININSFIYEKNIENIYLIMAFPLQLTIAGPIVRSIFRRAFPEGKVLA